MKRENRKIIVTMHAIEQARRRFRLDGDEGDLWTLDRWIQEQVAEAFAAGRVADHKPKEWRLYGEKKNRLNAGQRFVFTAENDRGWIVKSNADEIVVMTSLNRTGGVSRVDRVAAPRR